MSTAVAEEKRSSALEETEVVSFRCRKRFKRHIEKIARDETRNPTLVIERALKEYAERHGHEAFPER